jgi:hypothetical protein
MTELVSPQGTRFEEAMGAMVRPGRAVFSFAVAALGVETMICAGISQNPLGPGYNAIPVLPWLPAVPWLAILFGAVWTTCAVGLLFRRWLRLAAIALGGLLSLCTLILIVPRFVAEPGDMGLRTVVLEPLALAGMALLLPAPGAMPAWLTRGSRISIALAFVVFGADHFLALAFIASLIPDWIPWRVFWVAFFGAAFIAAGLCIGLGRFERWAAAGIGLMFAIWVLTLHVPRTLGFYGIPGALHDPDEWSSLFIAVGLWGGSWALAGKPAPQALDASE